MDDRKIWNWNDAEDEDGRHSSEDRLSIGLLLASAILAACHVAAHYAADWGWLS